MPATMTKPPLDFPTIVFAETYELIRHIEEKIAAVFADAKFELLVGPDSALHLRVYSSAESVWEVIDLVEDDVIALEDDEGLSLFVVPVRHEDRETKPPAELRRNGRSF
ncbi:MAG: hypothetical protein IIC91_00260 [Chloroflexi bacterium]|nr:hypothetical protein [Chloroflexota bacterium]